MCLAGFETFVQRVKSHVDSSTISCHLKLDGFEHLIILSYIVLLDIEGPTWCTIKTYYFLNHLPLGIEGDPL